MPDSDFAIPDRRAYPITRFGKDDIGHARNALSRVAAEGTPAEQAMVRAAVYARYPSLKPDLKKLAASKAALNARITAMNKGAGATGKMGSQRRTKEKAPHWVPPHRAHRGAGVTRRSDR